MKISLIQPGRNNLKYLKWAYDAIRKNQGNHDVEICVADDASTDGTWDWCQEMMAKDDNFKAILNDTGKRLGHTILYDRLVNVPSSAIINLAPICLQVLSAWSNLGQRLFFLLSMQL